MKKIINGRLYDTETAKELAAVDNGYGVGNAFYSKTALFQKKTGEYFIYGEGGPMSEYGDSVGYNRTWGCRFEPVDEFDAQKWVEKNCDGDTYIDLFGDVDE